MKVASPRRERKSRSKRLIGRRCLVERLEDRHLLAVLFADSFETGGGAGNWSGNWVDGGQGDWFRSTQRATDGAYSAEVDGFADNSTLTLATPIDLSGYDTAVLTFDWLIENGFDGGEYLALDISTDGGANWTDNVLRLDGNVDAENTWHNETVDLSAYASPNLLIQFRSKVSSSTEDANVDNVRIVGELKTPAFDPTIDYPDFSDLSGLTLLGSATTGPNDVLRLTPASQGQNGAAWHSDKQFVSLEWETEFSFNLNENTGDFGGSDGFAFVIQNNQPTYLVGGGGSLGYMNLQNSLVVEFDTFQNSENSDPSPSHISVHTNGIGANRPDEAFSIGSYVTPQLMDDANTHNVKIRYSAGVLKVFYDNFGTPVISTAVDLSQLLQLDAGRAWVGFTAATGGGWQNHDILNWQFRPLQDTSSIVAVDDATIVEGNSGPQQLQFNVYRLGDTSQAATVNWRTSDVTATSEVDGMDYVAASGQLVFPVGETSMQVMQVTIEVKGDVDIEATELLSLVLENLTNGVLADSIATGTILTDDVEVSISDTQVAEGSTGTVFLDRFVSDETGSIVNGRSGIFGPDGDFYVASRDTDEVLRFDGESGAYLGVFVAAGEGPLAGPSVLAFAPDGRLFVAGLTSDNVVAYDALGSFLVEFVPSGAFGLDSPRGMTFDSSGNLLVTSTPAGQDPSSAPHEVLRFQVPSGALPGTPLPAPGKSGASFISDTSLTLVNPFGLDYGPDGNLYVASANTGDIHRYDPVTGDFLNTFVSDAKPYFIKFEGDYLYATTWTRNTVLRFNATTGQLVDSIDPGNQAGLHGGIGIDFDSEGNLYVTSGLSGEVLRYGDAATAVVEVTLSSASSNPVTIQYSTADIDATADTDYTPRSGTLLFSPGETRKSILIPILDDSDTEGDEKFSINLSNVVGATIVDDQGVGTIQDNDGVTPTIFVTDLDASSSPGSRGKWNATVTVTVVNSLGQAMEDVAITGFWSDNPTTPVTIYTDATGKVTITRTNINKNTSSLTFTISNLSLVGYTYDALANHDDEGDSDGTEILILKPY